MNINCLFILGIARSGTTLLASIINNHSLFTVPKETHYFDFLHHNSLNEYFKTSAFKEIGFNQEVMKYLKAEIDRGITSYDFFIIMMQKYAEQLGKEFWAEKTPSHLKYIKQIKSHYPDSRFIIIVRDPRDVSLSWHQTPWNKNKTSLFHALYFRKNLKYILKMKETYGKDIYIIRYEDVITNTKNEIQNLCKFISIDFEDSMLNSRSKTNLFDLKEEPWKSNVLNSINQNNHSKWQKNMSKIEARIIQELNLPFITKFNYKLEKGSLLFLCFNNFFKLLVIVFKTIISVIQHKI